MRSLSAYYSAPISEFRSASNAAILGNLLENTEFAAELTQRDAWLAQIDLLKQVLRDIEGTLFLEFVVPRIGSRIDTVVIAGPAVFVIEFKVGEVAFTREARNQVWDYALDLKYFHQGSHNVPIVPILVSTDASTPVPPTLPPPSTDDVYPPIVCNSTTLAQTLRVGFSGITGPAIDAASWAQSPYRPTPTIIEAARSLYSRHSVDDISRNDADAKNLAVTSGHIESLIDQARATSTKIIVFVTGVPGAGKTLVGLNIATKKYEKSLDTHAVFLSGNGPLVAVLREALIRDAKKRAGPSSPDTRTTIAHEVKAFIQNVHHFRDDGLRDDRAPDDRVVIFDEAQRAWNHQKTANFMAQRKGRVGFLQSEPEFLISYMNRHPDWALVVCLVGGGQEINQGEAGIAAWFDALKTDYRHWHVYISPELTDSEYAAGESIQQLSEVMRVHEDRGLHLAVSMRSFRAENVSAFVKAVLDCEVVAARAAFERFSNRYPIVLTRNLWQAKEWVRAKARGSERYGLIVSSGAERLKPHAIDVRVKTDPVHWFLGEADDTRSSYYLEDAATEFQVQGLELDWACVTWDADLRFNGSAWRYHTFRGNRWNNVNNPSRRRYLLNAYRVLLTRARQGMVICVPTGDASDPTRDPKYYDATFDYLAGLGIPAI